MPSQGGDRVVQFRATRPAELRGRARPRQPRRACQKAAAELRATFLVTALAGRYLDVCASPLPAGSGCFISDFPARRGHQADDNERKDLS
jgi:hypothetical protein